MASGDVHVARVYDPPGPDDGARVLVDRLWPRGLRKEQAHLDAWLKEVAPSADLRSWYGHDPARHEEFARRYRAELTDREHADALTELHRLLDHGRVTLLTATRDPSLSQAAVLADWLIRSTEQKG